MTAIKDAPYITIEEFGLVCGLSTNGVKWNLRQVGKEILFLESAQIRSIVIVRYNNKPTKMCVLEEKAAFTFLVIKSVSPSVRHKIR